MMNYMESLTITEQEKLKKTIASLFRQTCILREKYDPITLVPHDNEQYAICTRHRSFIEQYLAITDCELKHDPQEHIYRLTGEGVETVCLSRLLTIIMLLIKIIYRDKILGQTLAETTTNLLELREYGKNTNLIQQKITDSEWKDSIRFLKRYQIVDYPGAARDLEDRTPIYIYSTINLYCSSAVVNELLEAYQEIILVDTRYISSTLLGEYVDFEKPDTQILFLYNTLLLNNSSMLK